jgi:hypothetical protein
VIYIVEQERHGCLGHAFRLYDSILTDQAVVAASFKYFINSSLQEEGVDNDWVRPA